MFSRFFQARLQFPQTTTSFVVSNQRPKTKAINLAYVFIRTPPVHIRSIFTPYNLPCIYQHQHMNCTHTFNHKHPGMYICWVFVQIKFQVRQQQAAGNIIFTLSFLPIATDSSKSTINRPTTSPLYSILLDQSRRMKLKECGRSRWWWWWSDGKKLSSSR